MLLLFYYLRQVDLILGLLQCYVAWPRWLKTLSLSLNSLASAIAWVILICLLRTALSKHGIHTESSKLGITPA